MKIAIGRKGNNIHIIKDYSDIKDTGEVSHILTELEFIKKDLLEIWEEMSKETIK